MNILNPPPSITLDEVKPSNKFKKLLSNKLQGKMFRKADIFNSFKAPCRNVLLEQDYKSITQSIIPYKMNKESDQTQNYLRNNTLSPFKASNMDRSMYNDNQQVGGHLYIKDEYKYQQNNQQNQSQGRYYQKENRSSTPSLKMQKMTPQRFQTPLEKKRLNTFQPSMNSVPITPDKSFSPRKKIVFNLNSAIIPSGLTTDSTLNQQFKVTPQQGDSFYQVQYLSRTKDKAFLDMIEKSKNQKNSYLNQLDIPSYQDYKHFISRQNALQQLLLEFRKPSKNNQQIESNEINDNQQPTYIYNIKNNINKSQTYNNQSNDIQGRVKKSIKINQLDLQSKAQGEIDQQLFESYLDCLKNNFVINMNRNDSPNSKTVPIKSKNHIQITKQTKDLPLDQSISDLDQLDSTQKDNSFNKFRKNQDKRSVHKPSILFNPNAFSQENYLSVAKKKSILLNRIEKIKNQQLSQQSSFNNENNDFIIENSTINDKNAQSSENQNQEQLNRLEQQIKKNSFSVINSPKSNKYDDERIIQNNSLSKVRNQTPQSSNKKLAIQLDDGNVKISDIVGYQKHYYHFQTNNDEKQPQNFGNQLKQQEISSRISEIDQQITQILENIEELKIIYNSTRQLTNIIIKIPGFNDMIHSFIFKYGDSNELQQKVTLPIAKKSILKYINLKYSVQLSHSQLENTNVTHPNLEQNNEQRAQILQMNEIPQDILEEIAKQIVYFNRNMFSFLQQKREGHFKKKVDEVKTEIKQISNKTIELYQNYQEKASQKPQSLQNLQNVQGNLAHIIERKNYIKQQPFIEKFEKKEVQLDYFKLVSEANRNKSKNLNELNDIVRNFNNLL